VRYLTWVRQHSWHVDCLVSFKLLSEFTRSLDKLQEKGKALVLGCLCCSLKEKGKALVLGRLCCSLKEKGKALVLGRLCCSAGHVVAPLIRYILL